MKIAYFARDRGACSYYRVELPNETLAKHKAAEVWKIEKGDNAAHISDALDSDLVIIPRVTCEKFYGFMKDLKAAGKKVAVEYDDYLFDLSPLSPHYVDYGDKEITMTIDGTDIEIWKDGKNIDLKKTQKARDSIKRALELADFTIVTTDILAKAYSEHTDRFAVLPNCVDTALWQPLPLKDNGEIRLYWSGGASHYEDFILLADVLPAIMDKYPNVRLVLMGQKFDGTLKHLPKGRVDFHKWVPMDAYPYKSAILNPTISLIPLKDTRFNRCKSPIKWIEQSALGVPSVMSMVSPYQEMFNGENAVMIGDNTPEQWFKGIAALIEDPLLRAKVGGEAKKTVQAKFDINTQYLQWAETYKRWI